MFANDLHLGTSRNGHGLLVGFSTAFPEMETAINLSPTTMEAPHLLVRFVLVNGMLIVLLMMILLLLLVLMMTTTTTMMMEMEEDGFRPTIANLIHNNAWVCLSRHLPGRLGGWPAPLVPGT